ncbi:hypothetical protein ACOSP7_007035 [Xanthoceras sorbifolium]
MVQFNISAKFLDIQIEYLVQDVENYTLGALWGDMYMMTCSSLPEPSETFKAKVRMPGEYKLLERDMDLQDVFQHFKSKGLDTIMVNIDLLPLVALNPEDMVRNNPTPTKSSHSSNNALKCLIINASSFSYHQVTKRNLITKLVMRLHQNSVNHYQVMMKNMFLERM